MANKKVSQLVAKPSVLVTDLFPIADPTTGQLFKTTISDLGTAIGSGVSSVNTLVGAVVLDTDDIQELASPTNRWFTDTRARAALSAGTGISYDSGTGVITNAVTSGQIATALGYTPANDSLVVKLAGTQTITGDKTFTLGTRHEAGLILKQNFATVEAGYSALAGVTNGIRVGIGATIAHDLIFSGSTSYTYTFPNATGTIALTSNLSSYLPLTGGTLTGDLTLSSGNPRLYFTDTDNNPDYFISNTDGTFTVYDVTNSTSRFTIGTTGNGTFGGNLTVGQIIRSGGTSAQFLKADGSVDSSVYALDSAVVKLTGTQSISGVKTFNSQPVFGNTVMLQNTASCTVLFGGYTTIWTTDSAFTALVGTASSTTIGFSLLYDSSAQRSYTMPTSNGTLALTSQLSAYLPLGGGTMTGVLFGASASFSGFVGFGGNTSPLAAVDVTGAGIFSSSVRSSGYYLTGMTSGSGALYYSSGSNRVTVANYNASGIVTFEVNGGNTALTLNSNLSASFASTITSSGNVISNGGVIAPLNGGSIEVYNTGNSNYFDLKSVSGNFALRTNVGAGAVNALTIATGGAATFSSSVTATQVGVNTTTPNAVLEVAGTSANTDFRVSRTVSSSTYFFIKAPGGTPSASTMGVNGTDVMTLNSSGNVGIGTTSPTSILNVVSSVNNNVTSPEDQVRVINTYSGGVATIGFSSYSGGNQDGRAGIVAGKDAASGVTGFLSLVVRKDAGTWLEGLRITSGGYLKLKEATTSTTAVHILRADTTSDAVVQVTNENTSNASDGMLTVVAQRNTTNNTFYSYGYYNIGSSAWRFRVADSGNVTNTNNSYGAISDIKLKENISDATSKLSDLLKIKIKNFNYIGSNEKQLGVIAQEVEEVFPALVEIHTDRDKEGNDLGTVTKSVKYSVFVPMLIKAVQELSEKITTLENK